MKFKNILSLDYSNPEHFVQSQWQSSTKSLTYLAYRCAVAQILFGIVANSIKTFIDKEQLKFYLIFFTHWGLIFALMTSILGVVLVTRWHFDWEPKSERNGRIQMNAMYKLYWFAQSVAFPITFIITFNYWLLVYNSTNELRADAWLKHGLNTVVLLIDVLVTKHQIKLIHFLHPLLVTFIYTSFTFIHFWLGGVNEHGHNFIYAALNWAFPLKASLLATGTLTLVVLSFILMYILQKIRTKLYTNCNAMEYDSTEVINLNSLNKHSGRFMQIA